MTTFGMKTMAMMEHQLIALKVAVQGIRGAYHEIAARKYFGDEVHLSECVSFSAIFEKLKTGEAQFGLMAIENTVAGTILPNYGLLRESNCRIVGEVYLRISHQLMALPGQRIEDITEVRSHPMAILQCGKFFENFPHLKPVEFKDTAFCARDLMQRQLKGVAAIASELSAELYGLEVIAKGIESNKRNFTRFLVLESAVNERRNTEETGKASICFNLSHYSGSLAAVLTLLSGSGMNLTKIQSLPVVGEEWEYFFHLDMNFSSQPDFIKAQEAIHPLVKSFKVLGEYSPGEKNV